MNGTDLLTSTQNGIQYLVCSSTNILCTALPREPWDTNPMTTAQITAAGYTTVDVEVG